MEDVERALRELEVATAAAVGVTLGDSESAQRVFKDRAKAVSGVAGLREALAALPAPMRAEAVSRIESALRRGEEARHRLLASKRNLIVEWARWNRVHLALAAQPAAQTRKLDCRG